MRKKLIYVLSVGDIIRTTSELYDNGGDRIPKGTVLIIKQVCSFPEYLYIPYYEYQVPKYGRIDKIKLYDMETFNFVTTKS
jgi:hypothetical protein